MNEEICEKVSVKWWPGHRMDERCPQMRSSISRHTPPQGAPWTAPQPASVWILRPRAANLMPEVRTNPKCYDKLTRLSHLYQITFVDCLSFKKQWRTLRRQFTWTFFIVPFPFDGFFFNVNPTSSNCWKEVNNGKAFFYSSSGVYIFTLCYKAETSGWSNKRITYHQQIGMSYAYCFISISSFA